MSSWVFHALGLPVEELDRTHLQLLGRACRPPSRLFDAVAPPPGVFPDSQGRWWESGDVRARPLDSATLRGAARGAGVTPKRRLSSARMGRGEVQPLLLPDLVHVADEAGPPSCAYDTGGRPGFPMPGASAAASSSGRTASRGAGMSTTRFYHPRITGARDVMVARRLRTQTPDHFCFVVPCCRVALGGASLLEPPAAPAQQWPRFVASAVFGGRVDGTILPATVAERGSEVAGQGGDPGRVVRWRAATGESLVLDFHGGPVPKVAPSGLALKDLLLRIEEQWVRKLRKFPVAWSVLWVETFDADMMLREIRGDGVPHVGHCPLCRAKLQVITTDGAEPPPGSDAARVAAAKQPGAAPAVAAPAAQFESEHNQSQQITQAMVQAESRMKAWEGGQVDCSRCESVLRRAPHATICPHFAERACHFRPLCADCRAQVEEIADMKGGPAAAGVGEDDASQGPDEDDEGDGVGDGVSRDGGGLPYAADVGVAGDREVCLAAELEMCLDIGRVPGERVGIFLEQVKDEIRRLIHAPIEQVITLQDYQSAQGIVQIGLLHPDLAELLGPPAKLEEGSGAPVEDIGSLWDRLVLALRGDAGRHRLRETEAFPLLRHVRSSEVRWLAALVAPREKRGRPLDFMQHGRPDGSMDTEDDDDEDGEELGSLLGEEASPDASSRHSGAPHARVGRTSRDSRKLPRFLVEEMAASATQGGGEGPEDKVENEDEDHGLAELLALRPSPSKLRPAGLTLRGSFPRPPAESPILPSLAGPSGARAEMHACTGDMFRRPPASELLAASPALAAHRCLWEGDARGALLAMRRATHAEANAGDRLGRRALHVAAAVGSLEAVRALLRHAEPGGPMRVDPRDAQGRTPLLYSVYRGDARLVECLLPFLSVRSIDSPTPAGETAVLVAARAGAADSLRALLDRGARADAPRSARGLAPLHCAAAAGSAECCELLLRHGGGPADARDALNRTPLEWAEEFHHQDVLELLRSFVVRDPRAAGVASPERPQALSRMSAAPPSAAASEVAKSELRSSRGDGGAAEALPARRWAGADGCAAAASPPGPTSAAPTSAPSPPQGPRSARGPLAARPRRGGGAQQPSPTLQTTGGAALATAAAAAARAPLLHGQLSPPHAQARGADWPGNVGSLAVRWRCWSRAAISEVGGASPTPLAGAARGSIGASPRELAAAVVLAEASAQQVGKVCEKLGGHFCTTCWEHVLDGHPED